MHTYIDICIHRQNVSGTLWLYLCNKKEPLKSTIVANWYVSPKLQSWMEIYLIYMREFMAYQKLIKDTQAMFAHARPNQLSFSLRLSYHQIPSKYWCKKKSELVKNLAINPNQTKGGYKVPEAFSNACHFVYHEVWTINPSSKFLFWC